ncbi:MULTISPECIES: 4Fe-4S single cluster domain-containing protein [Streptomyces]|uniref:4Fe-4S single cluster domain-containing protein n=1 Tax=Streptomyces TaxID=1883 RepID=UPI0018DFADF5|nr:MULTISPECIES: 4Fe-4S single cluster domain-containing protein [Streptomyces]MCZ4096918.1 4Fe-4S single cluster domain-containing protein [Streptomyces sp. H39-C1]
MTRIAVNRLHHPVSVLGHGVRAGVWVQGCTLACPGCMSRDTWEPEPDSEVEVGAVLDWVSRLPGPLDGITVSGGEPFQQSGPLTELLAGLKELAASSAVRCDLLVFSGYAWAGLRDGARHQAALALCDAVVTGPYVARRNTGSPLRGSDNQQVVTLTPLGHERYGPAALAHYAQRRIQATTNGSELRMIGIPQSGDLARWKAAAEAKGVAWTGTSWSA